jgi:lysozyme
MLAACAGTEDFLEPAEPSGHHPFPERHSTYGRHAHEVHGIDVAKYQGTIDWHAVKRSGIAFAFIKATEGADLRDERFAENWAAAKAAGIPRGAYHFNYWCSSFEDQFNWFRRNVPRDKDALPPVLDLEWNHASPTCPRKVSRARAKAEIRKFLRLAEAWYGKRPIIYTDIPFYRDVLSDGSFSEYPLWVRSVKRLPQDIYKGRKWALWQYSDRSRVPGIRGRVDKNVFAGNRKDWHKLVAANFQHRNVVTPPPSAAQAVAVASVKKPDAEARNANAFAAVPTQKPAPANAGRAAVIQSATSNAAEGGATPAKDVAIRGQIHGKMQGKTQGKPVAASAARTGTPLNLTPAMAKPKGTPVIAGR